MIRTSLTESRVNSSDITLDSPIKNRPIIVEEMREISALSALRPSLEALAAAMAAVGQTRGPFLTPDWATVTAAALADPRDRDRLGDFRLLVVRHGDAVVAALPLVAVRGRLAGVPARLLRSLSDDHSQRFDLWLDPGPIGDAAAGALLAHLVQRGDWDAIELQAVPLSAAAAARLVAAARESRLSVGYWPSMISPYLPLPASAADLDRQLSRKFRSNLRRRLRLFEAEVGPLTLERITGQGLSDDDDSAALDAVLDEGFALEAAGWKGDLGTAIACDPRLRARYLALARTFAARGQLACYFLKAGARRVAFHFALIDNDTYYLFKPGFDPALATYGLGHLLVDAVARDLIACGIREFDFLGDDMPWKREWTDQTRAHRFDYIFAPTLRGRILAAWKLRLIPSLKQWWRRSQAIAPRLHKR